MESRSALTASNLPSLRYELFWHDGQNHAFTFVLKHGCDRTQIIAEHEQVQHVLSNPPRELEPYLSPALSPRVFREGYAAALETAIHLLADVTNSPAKVRSVTWRRQLTADGQVAAFRFALHCQGDASKIQTEIREVEARIEPGTGSMAPSAGPRIYQDGYLLGLTSALEILARPVSDRRFPEAYPSPWFTPEIQAALQREESLAQHQYNTSLSRVRQAPSPILKYELSYAAGRFSAFELALDCEGDILRIQASQRVPIEQPPRSPDPYLNGYVAGLRDTVEIIRGTPPYAHRDLQY